MNKIVKTVISQRENIYSSFPTFTEFDNSIYIFYREATSHVFGGKVKCFKIEKELFINAFGDDNIKSLYNSGEEYTVFEGANENEALISKLEGNVFSLATRTYERKKLKSYMSFSNEPKFKERCEAKIKGIEWLIFYGKAFKWKEGYVFSAYGDLDGERPLVLITEDFQAWDVLSYLPSDFDGVILNESSIMFDGKNYTIFMREDTKSFGIWYSISDNLQEWTPPVKLTAAAHAPMSLYKDEKIYLTFRDLISPGLSSVSLMFSGNVPEKITIEQYKGSPYDGGYTDIAVINDEVYILYYIGNEDGEPFINICKLCN